VSAGAGWFCDKVVVREATDTGTDTDSRSMYFPCGQWLDRGQTDGLIERTLLPQQPPEEQPLDEPELLEEPEPIEEPPPELVEEKPKTKPSTFNNCVIIAA